VKLQHVFFKYSTGNSDMHTDKQTYSHTCSSQYFTHLTGATSWPWRPLQSSSMVLTYMICCSSVCASC